MQKRRQKVFNKGGLHCTGGLVIHKIYKTFSDL